MAPFAETRRSRSPWHHQFLSPAIERARAARERPIIIAPPVGPAAKPKPRARYIDVNPSFAPIEITDYDSLHALMCERAVQLGISRETLDVLTGLQSGYAAKILSRVQVKRLGRLSFGLMLDALCIKLIAVPNEEAFARNKSRLVQCDPSHYRSKPRKPTFKLKGTCTARLFGWPAASD